MPFCISNNRFWKEFFQLYSNMPELWQTNSEVYKNKDKKQKGWDRLLVKYKEYDKNAHLDSLKQKVHNIRSCNRRECRKVDKSMRSGNPNSVYKPNLWYYSKLEFLRANDEEAYECVQYSYDTSQTNDEQTMQEDAHEEQIDEITTPKVKRKKYSLKHETNDEWCSKILLKHNDDSTNDYHSFVEKNGSNLSLRNNNPLNTNAVAHKSTNTEEINKNIDNKWDRDEAKTYSESWATSYRKLSNNQRIMARKAIEEIFFLGQFEQLTPSVVCIPEMPLNATASISKLVEYRYDSEDENCESQDIP